MKKSTLWLLLLLISFLPLAYQLEKSYSIDININAHSTPLIKKNILISHAKYSTNESLNNDKIIPLPVALNYLIGTNIDGYLALDSENNLIVDQGLLDFFDYFLSARGRLSETQIMNHLMNQITHNLQGKPRKQAFDFLEKYQLYGNAYSALVNDYAPNTLYQSLSDTLAIRNELRQEYFGIQIADDLWSEQDNYDQTTLKKINKLKHPLLSTENNYDEEGIISKVNSNIRQSNLQHKKSLLQQKEHINSAIVYQNRALMLGADAADRLTILDRKNIRWNYGERSTIKWC